MQLRRLALVISLLALVPACSAIVNPDTSRLGDGPDAALGVDGGPTDIDMGVATRDTGMPQPDMGVPGPDTGHACASCDDMIPCTTDTCDLSNGTCLHTPNNGACTVGMRCSATLGCVVNGCTTAADCADGDMCNGIETCAPGTAGADPLTGCVHGAMPDCNDHVACTADSCRASSGCAHETQNALCDDTFACTTDMCTTTGCHHEGNNAVCNAGCLTGATCSLAGGCTGGASMTCGLDGDVCTQDPTTCDAASGMCLHPPVDADGDGHGAMSIRNGPTTVNCPRGDDCDDGDPDIHPGASELCDGIDNNCNGTIDESGCLPTGPDTCASEQQIALSSTSGGGGRMGMASGSTVGDTDSFTSCGQSGSRDALYYVNVGGFVTGALDVTFSTDSPLTTFDTVLEASIGTCAGFDGHFCNDDIIRGANIRSRLTVCVPAGQATLGTQVHVAVDGYLSTDMGNYGLTVTITQHMGACPG